MNKNIWKFQLETADYQTISMPKDAEILTVQTQDDTPCVWALVNPEAEKEDRNFELFGTGHKVPDMGVREYVATYQLHGGSLIFHVFERTN